MVNVPLGPPASADGISPGSYSQPARTPRLSPRGSPGSRFSRTAPGSASGFGLPPLAAWPKGEDFGGFTDVRPQTSPMGTMGTVDAFIERLSSPRYPASLRPGTSPRIASVPGGLALGESVARSMIQRQKQSFSNLQSKCDTLIRKQAKMTSQMNVMEFETRCLRVRATPPDCHATPT